VLKESQQTNHCLRKTFSEMARVLAISSQVVYGPVGLNCIVPALQAQGHEVLAIPTVLLSNHPGHGKPTGRATSPDEFAGIIEALEKLKAFDHLDAIITGYFASAEQVKIASKLIVKCNCKIILVDPVIGDDGKLYVSETVANAIRDQLLPLASIITPNAFELSWLTKHDVRNRQEAVTAARTMASVDVIATSVPEGSDKLCTLRVTENDVEDFTSNKMKLVPNGTGDFLSGLYLAHLLGNRPAQALADAISILQRAITLSKGTSVLAVAQSLSQRP
jgi:pyridoxine kinase